jgi:hypothetical protein
MKLIILSSYGFLLLATSLANANSVTLDTMTVSSQKPTSPLFLIVILTAKINFMPKN